MNWKEAEEHIVPLLANPGDWPHFRAHLEQRDITQLTLIGDNPSRPYSVQAHSDRGGFSVAGIDWRRPDAVRDALRDLVDELDTRAAAPRKRRQSRHGIGKKGRRER